MLDRIDWPALGGQVGLGAILGYAVGYTAKKALKLAMLAVGALVLVTLLLEQQGLVTVHWSKLEALYASKMPQSGLDGALRSWVESIARYVPLTGSFAVGFFLGFQRA